MSQQAPYAAPYAAPAQPAAAQPYVQPAYPQAGAPVFPPAAASTTRAYGEGLTLADKCLHPVLTTIIAVLYVVLVILAGTGFAAWAAYDSSYYYTYGNSSLNAYIGLLKALSIISLFLSLILAFLSVLASVATILYALHRPLPLKPIFYNVGRIIFPIVGLINIVISIISAVKGGGASVIVGIIFNIIFTSYMTYVFHLLFTRKVQQDKYGAGVGYEK